MGLARLRLGHEVEAQEAFQKAIEASGGHYVEPHFPLSTLLCNPQKFAEAEPIFRKALELAPVSAPGFGPSHFVLAWALFGLNRLDEVERIAQDVSLRASKLPMAHLLLAHIHIRRSGFSTGLVELDASFRLEPDGSRSKQIRRFQESLKRPLTGSVVINGRHRLPR